MPSCGVDGVAAGMTVPGSIGPEPNGRYGAVTAVSAGSLVRGSGEVY